MYTFQVVMRNHQLLLRLAGRQTRFRFSTASPASAGGSSADPNLWASNNQSGGDGNGASKSANPNGGGDGLPRLPSKHSRKRLPPVCTDTVMLAELTQQVLEAPEGSLFTYHTDKDSAMDAWDAADVVCQKVDFLVRGYAARLPGTMWQRWLSPSTTTTTTTNTAAAAAADTDNRLSIIDPQDASSVVESFEKMEALIDRIWDEGHAYMTVRADRMQEKAARGGGESPPPAAALAAGGGGPSPSLLDKANDKPFLRLDGGTSDEELDRAFQELANFEGDDDEEDDDKQWNIVVAGRKDDDDDDRPFMNDFALPGPTVDMFNNILDAMACHTDSSYVNLEQARMFWDDILTRHEIDGGDLKNLQPQTTINVLSYNAPIRIVANFPYKEGQVTIRDQGLLLAFEAYDALTHSRRCERNGATFSYLLQTVAKYMPPSRNKGNVAASLIHLAQEEGCVDQQVLDSYRSANTPSNGPEFDSWASKNMKVGVAAVDVPHAWRRNNKVRRHNRREATY